MSEVDFDVVIVGSGIVGAVAANELSKEGLAVLVIEAGPKISRTKLKATSDALVPDQQTQSKIYPTVDHAPSSHHIDYIQHLGPLPYSPNYLRCVGGTTWRWAAACWRLVENDFKTQSTYGVGRDWPIGLADLTTHYEHAEQLLGVSTPIIEQRNCQSNEVLDPKIGERQVAHRSTSRMDGVLNHYFKQVGIDLLGEPSARNFVNNNFTPVCRGSNVCMTVCPTGAQQSGDALIDVAVANGSVLVSDTVAYDFVVGRGGHIQSVKCLTPDRNVKEFSATNFIIAANGLETPRLLLLSSYGKNGVANSSDMVGRNLMDHPGRRHVILTGEPIYPGLGPVQSSCVMRMQDGAFRANHSAIKHSFRNMKPLQTEVVRFAGDIDLPFEEKKLRWLDVSTVFEQLPNPSNRIQLSKTKKDGIGLAVPATCYSIDTYTEKGATFAGQVDIPKFASALGGEIIYSGQKWENRDHIMGTTIMGSSAEDSVVDSFGRTFDHPNLFICGTSLFPAVGVANPTLTACALALRTVDHLVGRQ